MYCTHERDMSQVFVMFRPSGAVWGLGFSEDYMGVCSKLVSAYIDIHDSYQKFSLRLMMQVVLAASWADDLLEVPRVLGPRV